MADSRQGPQTKSAAESVDVPALTGVKALMGDLDRFAKEWTGMFDELYSSTPSPYGAVLANARTRIHPIAKRETPGTSRTDNLGENISDSESGGAAGGTRRSSVVGEEMTVVPLTPSVSTGSSTEGETVHFDVSAESLVRWQHRDNTMLKDAPTTTNTVSPMLFRVSGATAAGDILSITVRFAHKYYRASPLTEGPSSGCAAAYHAPSTTINSASPRGKSDTELFSDADRITKCRRSIGPRLLLALT